MPEHTGEQYRNDQEKLTAIRPLPPLAHCFVSGSNVSVSRLSAPDSPKCLLPNPLYRRTRPIAAGRKSQPARPESNLDQSFELGYTGTISAMNRRSLILFALSIVLAFGALAAPTSQERTDWSSFFAAAEAHGTIVVWDNRNGSDVAFVYDPERAGRRYSPASTFKIPHSLFALDAGILRDEFQVIPWDGVKRSIAEWNEDQNLRSAMRNSTVWIYEIFARRLGDAREIGYMRKIAYGNAVNQRAKLTRQPGISALNFDHPG